jgi:hypothetical protein
LIGHVYAQDTSEIDVTLDSPFDLSIRETANLESVWITLLSVTEDSRCPSDVTCIWQGQVTVQLDIQHEDQVELLLLTKNNAESAIVFDKYQIQLIDVKPYPISTQPIKADEYTATLKVISSAEIPRHGGPPIPASSPLKQMKLGEKIWCKPNLVLIFKYDGTPACVKPKTAEKLIERGWAQKSPIDTFEECVAAGNPVMESYPRQCKTPDGKHFVEEIDSKMMSPESLCQKYGGNWLQEFNECEMISAEQCSAMNGIFKECESACRHMPDAEICTKQCVLVCVVP